MLAAVAAAVVLVVAGGLALATLGGEDRDQAGSVVVAPADVPRTLAGAVPDFAEYGEAAELTSGPLRFTVNGSSSTVNLGFGTLWVPEGSLSGDVELTAWAFRMPVYLYGQYIDDATIIVLDADQDVASIDPPLRLALSPELEAPWVLDLGADGWELAATGEGPNAEAPISHFSKSVLTILTSVIETLQDLPIPGMHSPKDVEIEHQQAVAQRSPWTQAFYGVHDGPARRTQEEICEEIEGVINLYGSSASALALPDDYRNALAMGPFLFMASDPGSQGGYFSEKVAASQAKIMEDVLGFQPGADPPAEFNLNPEKWISMAQVLDAAIRANGGNIPLGLLAAHNFLKQVAYDGRLLGDPAPEGADTDVNWKDGAVASRLEPWRQTRLSNSAGRLDKMGPLYHIFAAATAGTWNPILGGDTDAGIAVAGEAFLRTIRFGTDVPDREKGLADQCGASIATRVRKAREALGTSAGDGRTPGDPSAPPPPPPGGKPPADPGSASGDAAPPPDADPDPDGDGITGTADHCPNEAETVNGYEDRDGCPDTNPDPDGDGIKGAADRCPNEAETVNGYEDGDGCPDTNPDPDGDGIQGAGDRCPEEAETVNGYEDADGCPDTNPDPDEDGVIGTADHCPGEAETVNGYEDADGCPDEVLPDRSAAYDFPLGAYNSHLSLAINFSAGTVSGTLSGSWTKLAGQANCGQGGQVLDTAEYYASASFSTGFSGSVAPAGGPFSAPVSINGTITYAATKLFTHPSCTSLNAGLIANLPGSSAFTASGTVSGVAVADSPTSINVSTTLGSYAQ